VGRAVCTCAARWFVSALKSALSTCMHLLVYQGTVCCLLKPVCCNRQQMVNGLAPFSCPGSFLQRALPGRMTGLP